MEAVDTKALEAVEDMAGEEDEVDATGEEDEVDATGEEDEVDWVVMTDEVDGAGEVLEEGTFILTLLTCIIITISTYSVCAYMHIIHLYCVTRTVLHFIQ